MNTKSKRIFSVVAYLMTLIVLCGANSNIAFAQSTVDGDAKEFTVVDDINNISDEDGTYVQYLEDGSSLIVNISSELISNPLARGTETHRKTYEYILKMFNSETVEWSSKLVGVFQCDGTYAWGNSGTAYFDSAYSSSTISYSTNTYSSAQTTGTSKYSITAKVTTPYGTYNISQYVGCKPNGDTAYNMSY